MSKTSGVSEVLWEQIIFITYTSPLEPVVISHVDLDNLVPHVIGHEHTYVRTSVNGCQRHRQPDPPNNAQMPIKRESGERRLFSNRIKHMHAYCAPTNARAIRKDSGIVHRFVLGPWYAFLPSHSAADNASKNEVWFILSIPICSSSPSKFAWFVQVTNQHGMFSVDLSHWHQHSRLPWCTQQRPD